MSVTPPLNPYSPLTLIESPPFVVDLSPYGSPLGAPEADGSLTARVRAAAARVFMVLRVSVVAIVMGVAGTPKTAWSLFKVVVIGYMGGSWLKSRPTWYLPFVPIKIIYWIAMTTFAVVKGIGSAIIEGAYPGEDTSPIKGYVSKEINHAHISRTEVALDDSGVPPETTLDTMLTFFDTCNFIQPAPHGFSQMSLLSEGRQYTPAEVRAQLTTLIQQVHNRTPFLGTPRAEDPEALEVFYRQIEAAIRLSLHALNNTISEFEQRHGVDRGAYSEATQKAYHSVLEDKVRMVVDLGIAGGHCGGRYMGEAMRLYYAFVQKDTFAEKTLGEGLIDFLSYERKEIAERLIAQDPAMNSVHNVHFYSNYMATLGPRLGIPGTQNVTEALASPLDEDPHLRRFFEVYTVDVIIEAVQEKIKAPKSQALREKIYDWCQTHRAEWSPWSAEEREDLTSRKSTAVTAILTGSAAAASSSTRGLSSEDAVQLLRHLKKTGYNFPPMTDAEWSDYIADLMSADEVKAWCTQHLPAPRSAVQPKGMGEAQWTVILDRRKKAALIEIFKALSPAQVQNLQGFMTENTEIDGRLFDSTGEAEKAEKRRRIQIELPGLQKETLDRLIDGELAVGDAVARYLEIGSEASFADALKLENMSENGLPPPMLEWVLVSQGILLPQKSEETPAVLNGHDPLWDNPRYATPQFARQLADSVRARGGYQVQQSRFWSVQNPEEFELAAMLKVLSNNNAAGNAKRYRIQELAGSIPRRNLRTEVLSRLFDIAFDTNRELSMWMLERSTGVSFYPRWKNICKIKIPRKVGDILASRVFGFFVGFCCAVGGVNVVLHARLKILKLIADRVTPFIMKNASTQMLQIGSKVHEWMPQDPRKVCLAVFLAREAITRLPFEIPRVTRAFREMTLFDAFKVAFGQFYDIVVAPVESMGSIVLRTMNRASRALQDIATRAETEKFELCKQRTRALWLRTQATQAA